MKYGKDIAGALLKKAGIEEIGHFVYKSGKHGREYLEKERLIRLGASGISILMTEIVRKSLRSGLKFNADDRKIAVIGPAMGAISLASLLALAFEKEAGRKSGPYPEIFMPARTELQVDATGKKTHIIPEKLLELYREGDGVILIEDIVNSGTTIREMVSLLESAGLRILAVVCIADRGGQTARSLGVKKYCPLKRMKRQQHDAKDCPQCAKGVPITTKLGKGERWVKLFGQPPYQPGTDFSKF